MISPDPGKVRSLIITRREYPHHRWEPVFIGIRDDPFYAEDMSWEGKQDKMSQVYYTFIDKLKQKIMQKVSQNIHLYDFQYYNFRILILIW